jgi:hypothetical protein
MPIRFGETRAAKPDVHDSQGAGRQWNFHLSAQLHSPPQFPNQPLLPPPFGQPSVRRFFPEFLPNRPDLSPAFLAVLQWVYGRALRAGLRVLRTSA